MTDSILTGYPDTGMQNPKILTSLDNWHWEEDPGRGRVARGCGYLTHWCQFHSSDGTTTTSCRLHSDIIGHSVRSKMLLAKEYPTLSLFSTLHSPSSLPPHVPRPARTRDCGQHSVDRQRDTASATAPTPPGFLSSTLSGTLLGTFSPSSAV